LQGRLFFASITENLKSTMSEEQSCCCRKPEKLAGKPEECSPETVRECHGTENGHVCVPDEDKEARREEPGA